MFDPYHKWLGIPPKAQPPNHYRLLVLDLFESDSEVIASAADRQMVYLQQRATGEYAALSQKLLNEVAAARLCLLDPGKKAQYDEGLARQEDKSEAVGKASIPDSLGESEAVAPEQPPAPVAHRTAPPRSWKVEPWHFAVLIGVVFCIGLAVSVVRSPRLDRSTLAEATPAPDSGTESKERAANTESERVEMMDESSAEDDVSRASADGASGAGNDEAPTEVDELVYNVTVSPSSVDLRIRPSRAVAVIEGTGRNRQIRVENPSEVNDLTISASCEGYVNSMKFLHPSSSEETDISIILKANKPKEVTYTVRVSPPHATVRIPPGKGTISQSGSYRVARLWDDAVRLEATCDGYSAQSKRLDPSADGTRSVSFSLVASAPIELPAVLRGHKSDVLCVAVSPGGRYIASGGTDRSVRCWDLPTGKQVWKYDRFTVQAWAVAFTSDGKHLWACGDREAKCFYSERSSMFSAFMLSGIKGGRERAVAFSPGASRLAVCAKGAGVVYDMKTTYPIFRLDNAWVPCGLLDREGRFVCGRSHGGGTVDQLDDSTGEVVRSFNGLRGRTTALALSTDEKYLAAASGPAEESQSRPENKIVVWRYGGEVVQEISVQEGWQYALAFSPDNRYLVSGGSGKDSDLDARDPSSDRSIRVWEIKTGQESGKFDGHEAAVRCFAFTPDGRYLVSGSADATVRVWPFPE